MTTNRWTQDDEDAARLPEGMQRIAYDADRRRYTFRDREGNLYQSAPGSEYGSLTPIPDPIVEVLKSRPNAFATDDHEPKSHSLSATDQQPSTFYEILPPKAITSASSDKKKSKFAQAMRLFYSLQRSIISRKAASSGYTPMESSETRRLLQTPRGSMNLECASSSVTAFSDGPPTSSVTERPLSY